MSSKVMLESLLPPNIKPTGIEVNVSVPGKVILHGEHSVVYGKLALAASLGLRTKLQLVEIDAPNIVIIQLANLNFSYKFDLQKISEQLLNSSLPIVHPLKDFSWEYPDLIHHETLMDRVKRFMNSTIGSTTLETSQVTAMTSMFYLLAGILGSTNVELRSFFLTVNTELHIGAGTGSSASYLVGLSAIFVQYVKMKKICENFSKTEYKHSFWAVDLRKFNKKELEIICNWAFNAEKIVHGTPSGLDNTICTYGSMVQFRKGLIPKMLRITAPFKILLINTNIARETKQLVMKVAKLHEKYPDLVNNILNALEEVAFIALQNITKLSEASSTKDSGDADTFKHYEELGTLASINHNLLSSLGVSHLKLDEIICILAQYGLKGKLTGAGGGGYAISWVPPYIELAAVENVMEVLKSKGFEVVCTTLGGSGVMVE